MREGSVLWASGGTEARENTRADDQRAARRAVLRLLTYGLYVVTVHRDGEHNGFTANWLTQASFDPPLIVVSVESDSHSIGMIRDTGIFTVNVLPAGAVEMAGQLGRHWAKVPDKISKVRGRPGPNGCIVLDEALGYLECSVEGSLPAGDSTIFVAGITGAELLRDGAPLRLSDTPYKHAG